MSGVIFRKPLNLKTVRLTQTEHNVRFTAAGRP
jgi:hypothetical protein